MANTPVYLGIDPGLNRTGYAVIGVGATGPRLVEAGVIASTKGDSLAERVHEIGSGVKEVLAEFQPQSVAIEQVFSHAQYPKTAVLMAHARGAILYSIQESKIPAVHYSATQIKRLLTGSGRAGKEQIQLAIQQAFHLPAPLEPNDVADAAAIALCHFHLSRREANWQID